MSELAGKIEETGDVAGRVVLITGGSRALGAATAQLFAQHGARVVVSGRDQTAIDDVVNKIRAEGGTAIGVAADVTRTADLEQLRVATERELGHTDILLAFAGGGGAPVREAMMSEGQWRATIDGDLTGAYLTVQTFLPGMIERRRGAIVTMSSAAARQPAKSNVAYAAAKAGVIAMTRHLAMESAPHGVRINCIAPSAVVNERMRAHMSDEQMAAVGESFPLRRLGQPRDVAEAALYLASDRAGWITGTVLDVAGGKIMV